MTLKEIWQDTIHPVKKRKYSRNGYRYGRQNDQALQKILKQFTGNDPEFHNQWFDVKNNQTFPGVHV